MTILAAQPDSAVVVQADYYSPDEPSSLGSALPAIEHDPPSTALVATDTGALTRSLTKSSYNPIQLYLRTQRSFDPRKTTLLDVLA